MYKANKDHPDIQEMIPVKGCPPKTADIVKALHRQALKWIPACLKAWTCFPVFS